MNTISLKLDKDKILEIIKKYAPYEINDKNDYVEKAFRVNNTSITIYKSSKVVFQGENANLYAANFLNRKYHNEAGSDEVGTGDYFGPVCVCACLIEEKDNEWLKDYILNDSKQLNDGYIRKIGPLLIERLKHSLLVLSPSQYNEVSKNNNANEIKAKMHNKAYLNLIAKGYTLPKATYVDEFVKPSLYFNYLKNEKEIYRDLIFETKAESNHPAVAAASIMARYSFLLYMDNLSKKVGFILHKGAGEKVDSDALAFVKKFGYKKLKEVAKLHFANTTKINIRGD